MTGNLKDILAGLSSEVDQETLLLYLQNKLTEEKKHEVEKILLDNEFADEAMDGLKEFHDKQQIHSLVDQLNADLRKKLDKKKQRREKLRFKDQPWLYISLLIILLLVIIGYMIVHRMLMKP